MQIPVVSSDCEPLARIIKENDVGLIYHYNDHMQLTDTILQLINDEEQYKQIQANQHTALEKYNWSFDAKNLTNLYQEMEN
jgi:glycosyltransferase involved in cell wall biosynthesis